MDFKKFLLFGVIFCLLGALKVQGESLSEENANAKENSDIKLTDQVKTTSEVILNNKNDSKLNIKPQEMENKSENSEKALEPNKASNDTPNVLNVMELALNDEDQVMLQNLNGIIEKVPEMNSTTQQNRESKSFKDENLKRAAEALTDDEITEIIKSISFPHNDEISEDSEAHKLAAESDVEPRSVEGMRMGKSLKSHNHGYYVIAFTPVEDETDNKLHDSLPYTRLQILPAERSMNGDAIDNPRFISKKSWNRYIRRIMRQIRKGTRKIQRKTKVKTLKEEPTVENFLKRMYKISQEKRLKQQQSKKKSSWFIW